MAAEPILVLQLRRLGDLILTFPLLRALQQQYPGHPLWVGARQLFSAPLTPLAPQVRFLSPGQLSKLEGKKFHLAINLGGASSGATVLGSVDAPVKLGAVCRAGDCHIHGFWHLYRECLTQNNRHNVFHWADLFRMDCIPLPLTDFPKSPPQAPKSGRIGLFVGASEAAKRPDAAFWAALSARLAKVGLKPVLFGGPGESALGEEIMARGGRAVNFCGKTTLTQLAGLLTTLDLFITPDTGPMHLADLLGVPVLNLSMGNVQALETGPMGPGQYVLRPAMSCTGCWSCIRPHLSCHWAFKPHLVAQLATALVQHVPELPSLPGLELMRTGRDELGLFTLVGRRPGAHTLLDGFWRNAFLSFFDAEKYTSPFRQAAQDLKAAYPALAQAMRSHGTKMLRGIARANQRKQQLPDEYWHQHPWHSRLLAGHLQMTLQNANYSAASRLDSLARLESVHAALAA